MKFILLTLFFCMQTFAGETARVSTVQSSTAGAGLPRCIDDPVQVGEILNTEKSNSSTDFKYDGFRKALSSSSDSELIARLAYSEALAANCPENLDKIIPLIKEVIENRIRLAGGDTRKVIFKPNQFASSLNNYSESRYKDFLCPKTSEAWKMALGNTSSELGGQAQHYYLFKHSARFTPPVWAGPSGIQTSSSSKIDSCIKFYN